MLTKDDLCQYLKLNTISSLVVHDIAESVMSQVCHIVIDDKLNVIAKQIRADFPQEEMFRVEIAFYNIMNNKTQIGESIFIPRVLFQSPNQLLILEKLNGKSIGNKCPISTIDRMITCIANLHHTMWDTPCDTLSKTAGIGSALPGLQKEIQFPNLYETFLSNVNVSIQHKEQLHSICQQISSCSISNLHDSVHHFKAFIHGDLHMGNILLMKDNQFGIVDWATCGSGNPMRDVAFFLIVSCDWNLLDIPALLQLYYTTLNKPSTWTIHECKTHFYSCVLDQFIILVCYDALSKQIAHGSTSSSEKSRLLSHFDRVNANACQAVLQCFTHATLPPKSAIETHSSAIYQNHL